MMKNVSAAAFILNDRGEVLLVHHTYGAMNWELPGGGGEPNESPAETAVREVSEETGLDVRALATTGWYHDPTVDKLAAVFLCQVDGERAPIADGKEISECRWWTSYALPRPISDWTILRIEDALSGRAMPLPTVIGVRVWMGVEEGRDLSAEAKSLFGAAWSADLGRLAGGLDCCAKRWPQSGIPLRSTASRCGTCYGG